MSMFGIMRVEKRRRSSVYGLQIEANRTEEDYKNGRDFDRSDIDWNLTQYNEHLVKTENWNRAITEQIHSAGLKEKKSSVVMIDGLYTASSEWFEEHTVGEWRDYFRDCLDFHIREFCGGDKSRLINAVIHMDEKTPHMQVASVPICEDEKGKHLSAKIIMGNRKDYQLRQDRFFEQVTAKHWMERGERRDPAEVKVHTTKREWQIATQEQALEQARQQTLEEQRKTQEIIEERIEALRERDKAVAGREVAKALAEAQKCVLSPVSVEVDILAEYDAKKPLFGQETPKAVKISKADLERLQSQARVNEQVYRAATSMKKSLEGMKQAAREANENKIDKQEAANAAAVSEQGRRVQELEQELEHMKQSLIQEQLKSEQLSVSLEQVGAKAEIFDRLVEAFPRTMERLQGIDRLERIFDKCKLSRSQLDEYVELCKAVNIKMRADIQEAIDHPKRSNDWELSL